MDRAGLPVPMAPMIGVSVVRQDRIYDNGYAGRECLLALDGYSHYPSWLYDRDAVVVTTDSPLLSGAAQATVVTPTGDRIYGLAIPRTRLVGLVPESMCYIVVVSLPADSIQTEAQVYEIFATFRFR